MVHMLHTFERSLQLMLLSAVCCFALTSDILFVNWNSHPCYAYAMIGSDEVINGRLGVPAEAVLKLAEIPGGAAAGQNAYSIPLLITLLEAYLWEQSPYHYSLQVFQRCAAADRTAHPMQFSNGSDMMDE